MHDPGDENDYQHKPSLTDHAEAAIRDQQEGIDRMMRLFDNPETICAEADRLVSGERSSDYGHPLDNYTAIAGAAGALELDVSIPEHAALFMVLTKISREVHRPKRDNRVDMAGYAKVVDLIHEERARRGEASD